MRGSLLRVAIAAAIAKQDVKQALGHIYWVRMAGITAFACVRWCEALGAAMRLGGGGGAHAAAKRTMKARPYQCLASLEISPLSSKVTCKSRAKLPWCQI